MAATLTAQQLSVLSKTKEIISEVKKVIIGKDETIIKVLVAIFSGGHILIEDIPGVGKTTLALALSKALSLDYKRLQFTPDVLPTDVTGYSIFNRQTGAFEYREGTAYCNLFLADEINRTSSKTQSALLEIMEEGKVTVDGITRAMPDPYVVIATQNPVGSIGTQMLPESQLDRFIIRIKMGYPSFDSEVAMLKSKNQSVGLDSVCAVMDSEQILFAKKIIDDIYVSDKVFAYIAQLAGATRENPYIALGLSPRGTIALTRTAKTTALLRGRDYVLPDDVIYMFKDVAEHRILLSPKAKINDIKASYVLDELVRGVEIPKISKE
ncbi:MAG: MoxR family ATPase [Oscillospiraceae bacterium]